MRGRIHVRSTKLQSYNHNYCTGCITGLLGCRWQRYKQSTRDSTKCDLFWFTVFTLAFLYVVFYFYFWLVVKNSFHNFNWQMFGYLKTWIPWYRIALGLVCSTFLYFCLVMCLFLCHVLHGKQLYMHPVHIVLVMLSLAGCIMATVAIDLVWSSEWTTTALSLLIVGPFLQIGAVILMTGLAWIIAQQWFKMPRVGLRIFWLVVYLSVMIVLYISPLFSNHPCVTQSMNLPKRPKVVAHRGASAIFPENTILSFQYALDNNVSGLETDVQISNDCVPFLLHDHHSFLRTTNIKKMFPGRVQNEPSSFNISDIKSLDAGSWFLETDPYWNVGGLSDLQRSLIKNQTIPTLLEFAILARNISDLHIIFDLKLPSESHPCYNNSVNITIGALVEAGFPMRRVWWLETTFNHSRPVGVTLVAETYLPLATMKEKNFSMVNVQYTEVSVANIQEYRSNNISVNMWTINSPWFFSLYWCLGVTSVTTDNSHIFVRLTSPVWHLRPSTYLILWVTIDVLSAVIIMAVFVVQRYRCSSGSFSPGTIINSAAQRVQDHNKRSRNMKENLLRNMSEHHDLGHVQDVQDIHDVQDVELFVGQDGITTETGSAYSMYSINTDSDSTQNHLENAQTREVGGY